MNEALTFSVWSFGLIFIRISDPRSLRSYVIKGSNESVTRVNLLVHLMHHDLGDIESLILILITPQVCIPKQTLKQWFSNEKHQRHNNELRINKLL